MTENYGLDENTLQKIRGVFARYSEIEKAVIYGSRAMGNYKRGSDIDITLFGGSDLTLNILYKIMNDLDDLLLPYTIDLSIFHQIRDPDVIEQIKRRGSTFYNKVNNNSEQKSHGN